MADFTTTITDLAVIDADEVTQFESGIVYGYTPELVMDQIATIRREANAKTVQFAVYANLSAISSAITDGEDVASVALADSVLTLTPLAYGNAVTLTREANMESAGKAAQAAGFLIGRNGGQSLDKLAMTAAEAFSTTRIYPNQATAVTDLAITDNLDSKFAGRLYTKLARVNVPGIGGSYVGVAHEDCLYDLRNDAGVTGWVDVGKYANPQSVLQNEVGMFQGIRWLRSSNVTTTSNSNGTIDSYKVNVFGANALGKAEQGPIKFGISGPFDKTGRILNYYWVWLGVYGVLDTANMVQGLCASSVGSN